MKKKMGVYCNLCGKNVFKNKNNYFMLKDSVWREVCSHGKASYTYILCRRCAERCLGRRLTAEDLNDAPINGKLKWKSKEA